MIGKPQGETVAERAAEERRGPIRWLRPEFQNAAGTASQTGLDTDPDESTTPAAATVPTGWPENRPLAQWVGV